MTRQKKLFQKISDSEYLLLLLFPPPPVWGSLVVYLLCHCGWQLSFSGGNSLTHTMHPCACKFTNPQFTVYMYYVPCTCSAVASCTVRAHGAVRLGGV